MQIAEQVFYRPRMNLSSERHYIWRQVGWGRWTKATGHLAVVHVVTCGHYYRHVMWSSACVRLFLPLLYLEGTWLK